MVQDMGPLGRARASVAAVETLSRIRAQGRVVATDGERVALSGWSGWGPLAPVFSAPSPSWEELHDRLAEALPAEDLRLGMQGTYNAFYTPPRLAEAMWRMLREFGYTGGQVVELGCGGGVFFGTAPEGTPLLGVERDPTAAGICELLHPHAQVHVGELQGISVGSTAAAVIGNVPFGNVRVHDPLAPAMVTDNLHNYFVWRAVQALAPGGYAVLLTSRFTMDAAGEWGRALIGGDADLVGAIRLPNGALAGGTEAGADIVILRRKGGQHRRRHGHDWRNATTVEDLPGLKVNEYWQAEPGAVMGRMVKGQTTQHGLGLQVEADGGTDLIDRMLTFVRDTVVPDARARDLMWQGLTAADTIREADLAAVTSREGWPEGTMRLTDGGGVLVVTDGRAQPLPKPGRELLALLRLRDLAVALVDAEADLDRPDGQIEPLRADARSAYESYVKTFGPLNRYKQRVGPVDEETGLPSYTRTYPTMQGFRRDPDASLVFALEMYADDDEESDDDAPVAAKAKAAPLLMKRQNRRRPARTRTDDPGQALAWCLDVKGGRVDLDYIAVLLGKHLPVMRGCPDDRDALYEQVVAVRADTARELGERVYLEPTRREWVTAEEYLSGDVRAKHLAAQTAAKHDAQFDRNVAALEQALPVWLEPHDISVQIGTTWIGPADIMDFIAETLNARVKVVRVAEGNRWEVDTMGVMTGTIAASARWGTPHVNAFELIEKALNNQVPQAFRHVEDPVTGDKKRVKDPDASLLAVQKTQELQEEFADWLWRDPARTKRLVHLYNTRFNSLVARTFDGSHITIDGLAEWFKPYAHQLEMVARGIATGATICGHPVGAGKTYTMAMLVMKLKQLGLVSKPMIVVPNHLIEQVDREIRQLFPTARILVGASKTVSANRRAFTARCATQDWDIVLVTHEAFNRMNVSDDTQVAYIDDAQQQLHEGVVQASGGRLAGRMVKRLAKKLDAMKAKILELRAGKAKDVGVRFEQLGVDYVAIDEFHYYKNLAVDVRTEGFSIKPSKRATDLDMKLRYLAGRGSGRYAALFSGTPMSNTMLELYVCMHYTMLPYLRSIGIGSPDAWAATFVQFVTAVEVTVDGGDFQMRTRPSLFVNADDLWVMLSQVADIRTAEQLGLKRPPSELHIVAVEPTDVVADYSTELVERAAKCRSGGWAPRGKGSDNMLKVCSDGRRVATDPALVGLDDPGRGKLHAVAEEIVKLWKQHPGKLQIAFCDLGTPFDPKQREAAARRKARKDAADGEFGWGGFGQALQDEVEKLLRDDPAPASAAGGPVKLDYQTYGRLRRILVDAGMDVSRIRFIHDAKTDAQRAQLFRECRRGKVDVILGSTDKMGVGTNIQKRAIAVHHIDAPFRPSDVEQRDGRALRPGNTNKLVHIFRYVTKRTFDAYMWQMLRRKLTFIAQMLSGNVGRTVEDIGCDAVMSFSEVEAAATDQPLLKEKATLESEVKSLVSAQRSHRAAVARCVKESPRLRESADHTAAKALSWEAIAAGGDDISDDDAARVHEAMAGFDRYPRPRVHVGGLTFEWKSWNERDEHGFEQAVPSLTVDGGAGPQVVDSYLRPCHKASTVAKRIRKVLAAAADVAAKLREGEAKYLREAEEADAMAARPFEHGDRLTALQARLDQIKAELQEAASGGSDGAIVVNDAPAAEPAPAAGADAELLRELDDMFAQMSDQTRTTIDSELVADLDALLS